MVSILKSHSFKKQEANAIKAKPAFSIFAKTSFEKHKNELGYCGKINNAYLGNYFIRVDWKFKLKH